MRGAARGCSAPPKAPPRRGATKSTPKSAPSAISSRYRTATARGSPTCTSWPSPASTRGKELVCGPVSVGSGDVGLGVRVGGRDSGWEWEVLSVQHHGQRSGHGVKGSAPRIANGTKSVRGSVPWTANGEEGSEGIQHQGERQRWEMGSGTGMGELGWNGRTGMGWSARTGKWDEELGRDYQEPLLVQHHG